MSTGADVIIYSRGEGSECAARTEGSRMLCRFCAKLGGTVSVFERRNDLLSLCEQAMLIAPIKISPTDGLPHAVCRHCVDSLAACYAFHRQCKRADRLLRLPTVCLDLVDKPRVTRSVKDRRRSQTLVGNGRAYSEKSNDRIRSNCKSAKDDKVYANKKLDVVKQIDIYPYKNKNPCLKCKKQHMFSRKCTVSPVNKRPFRRIRIDYKNKINHVTNDPYILKTEKTTVEPRSKSYIEKIPTGSDSFRKDASDSDSLRDASEFVLFRDDNRGSLRTNSNDIDLFRKDAGDSDLVCKNIGDDSFRKDASDLDSFRKDASDADTLREKASVHEDDDSPLRKKAIELASLNKEEINIDSFCEDPDESGALCQDASDFDTIRKSPKSDFDLLKTDQSEVDTPQNDVKNATYLCNVESRDSDTISNLDAVCKDAGDLVCKVEDDCDPDDAGHHYEESPMAEDPPDWCESDEEKLFDTALKISIVRGNDDWKIKNSEEINDSSTKEKCQQCEKSFSLIRNDNLADSSSNKDDVTCTCACKQTPTFKEEGGKSPNLLTDRISGGTPILKVREDLYSDVSSSIPDSEKNGNEETSSKKRQRIYECSKCTDVFGVRSLYKDHRRMCFKANGIIPPEELRSVGEDLCSDVTSSIPGCNNNINNETSSTTIHKNYECAKCLESFEVRSVYRNHRRLCLRCDGPVPPEEQRSPIKSKSNEPTPNEKEDRISLQTSKASLSPPEGSPKTRDASKRHRKRSKAPLPRICRYCGQVLSNRSKLKEHIETSCTGPTHLPIRDYMCDQCGKTFKHRNVLQQHMTVHLETKGHSCRICGKAFTRAAHVVSHLRIHNNIKPYVCESCGRSFTKSSDLTRHRRIHSDVRNYPCSLCCKTFKRSGDVVSHMRTHTGDRPYKCEPCNKSYTNQSSLKKHRRSNCTFLKGSPLKNSPETKETTDEDGTASAAVEDKK